MESIGLTVLYGEENFAAEYWNPTISNKFLAVDCGPMMRRTKRACLLDARSLSRDSGDLKALVMVDLIFELVVCLDDACIAWFNIGGTPERASSRLSDVYRVSGTKKGTTKAPRNNEA